MNFVKYVDDSTSKYLNQITKIERKKIGQFFTNSQTAAYMGSLIKKEQGELNILDPGAGSGILSAAVLEYLYNSSVVSKINLDLYENNVDIVPILKSNLDFMKNELLKHGKVLNYNIYIENFIISNKEDWEGGLQGNRYDIIISNPPYLKISKDAPESKVMSSIVFGQPNIYFLFMAMAAHLLKDDGELVFIVPRSFASGLYFTAFRKYFFKKVKVTNLHLFVSRDDVFNCDSILQETIILRAVKTVETQSFIKITESESSESFKNRATFMVPYKTCVRDDSNSFFFLPTKEDDIGILEFINGWSFTLPEIGFKLKTGLTVDFRNTRWLQSEKGGSSIPLLWSHNVHGGRVVFPVRSGSKQQYVIATDETRQLQMKIDNYVILKRFTSKEERRRLQCAIIEKEQFSEYPSISTENHLNYITKVSGKMSKEEMYGIFLIFNTSYMDKYFRILNGSTQVNANEINSMPVPSYEDVVLLGGELIKSNRLDEEMCDGILENRYMNPVMLKAE
jgi:adenine-specific DNA-methyltransferase